MLKTLLYKTSIFSVKFIIRAIKLLKIGAGTNLPGKIARKISPDLLSYLVKQNSKEIFVITGTNGKTTTSGLIASILREYKRKVVHNSKGANLLTGLTTTVAEKADLRGKLDSDNCLFEIDEAFLSSAFDEFTPDIIGITNLFRDQLDRYGELNTTALKIETAVEKAVKAKPVKIILNADDPIVSRIAEKPYIQRVFFGFNEIKFINQEENITSPQETTNCSCGERFSYSKIFYGHLGIFQCRCGVKRPEPTILADAVVDVSSSTLKIKYIDKEVFPIIINLPGVYNCYNALCAATIALEAGIPSEIIKKGILNYSTTFGRAESINFKGKEILIQLIKNPIGATEVLRTLKNDERGKLLIIINDNYADGRDVSWLWDASFEMLSGYKKQAIVSGIRASDMAVRLKYAGIPQENIIINENIQKAFIESINSLEKDEILYILPTYTALLELEKIRRNLPKKNRLVAE